MKKKLLLAALLCFSTLTACSPGKPKLCATVYPVQYLIKSIGGEYVESCNITENKVIQRASIKSDFSKLLKDADALFYIGGLEPYMDIYQEDISSSNTDLIDLSARSAIYKFQRYFTTYASDQTAVVEGSYYDGDIFKSIDQYANDPMIWMDPIAMTSMGSSIRDYLVKEYPEYKKVFNENFESLQISLARLDSEYQDLKAVHSDIKIVTMTPSFGYWQKSYGINVYPVILSRYGALPSNAQLAVIKQRIIDDGVRYIAYEDNMTSDMKKLYNSLKNELGLITIDLSNLSSLSAEDKKANKNYLSIMYENLKVLEALE